MTINNEATILNDLTAIPEDLISVVCHYDSQTVLTRSGEISQIIKVQGYKNVFKQQSNDNLRDLVRAALVESIASYDILIQLHVIRDYKDITSSDNSFINQKASKIDEQWNQLNNWHNKLDNTLYIVITHRGLRNYINPNSIIRQFFPWSLKNKAIQNLKNCAQELNEVSQNVKLKLKDFNSHILTIKHSKNKNEHISEPLSFVYYLLYFIDSEIPVKPINFAHQATNVERVKEFFNSKYTQPNNKANSKIDQLNSRYAAIFSLKTSYDITIQMAEKILQADYKFIICETIIFTEATTINSSWVQHKRLYEASKFPDMGKISGLNRLLISKNDTITDFCQNQITISIIANSNRELQTNTLNFGSLISEIGLNFIRDDVLMSGLFYAMLPGNHKYLSRLFPNSIARIAPFTNTILRGIGRKTQSNWGPPMMMLPELTTGAAYYFHLHNDKDNPEHCLVIKSSRSNTNRNTKEEDILRFILAQSIRFNPAIINIDLTGIHQDFITQIEGYTIDLGRTDEMAMKIGLNLFDVCLQHDTSMDLLLEVIRIYINKGEVISREIQDVIKDVVKNCSDNINTNDNKYSYSKIAQSFADLAAENNTHTCITNISIFLNNPLIYNAFSTNRLEPLSHTQRRKIILNLNLKTLYDNSPEAAELFAILLLVQLPESLINTPTLIALSNSDFIFRSEKLIEIFIHNLDTLATQNCVVINSISNINQITTLKSANKFFAAYANKFFMTDRKMTKNHRKILGIEENEIYKIRSYDRNEGNFLLKRRDCSFLSNISI